MLLIGMSGMGKSTELRKIATAEIEAGRGLLLVDPHADLGQEVIASVPRSRKNDLVVIDAVRPDLCPGLNPLQGANENNRALIASYVISAVKKFAGTSWGFRSEHVLRAALLAVLETRGPTLVDVERMLFDESHRHWVLKQTKDERVRRFWSVEFPGYGRMGGEAVAAPANKIGALLAAPHVRTILTKTRPKFDARRALDMGRIVIASLPKGRIGEEVLILGNFLLARFQQAAMSRADADLTKRRPFTILVDEIANFAPASLIEMLAETRKFGIRLVLACQSISIMSPELQAALLANAGHLCVYRVRGKDAEVLGDELLKFRAQTLTSLDVGERVERIGGRDAVLRQPRVE